MDSTALAQQEDPAPPRLDAEAIGLAAIRSILEAAAPLELELEGTPVRVTVAPGPRPPAVQLDCRWPGGRVALTMTAASGRPSGHHGLRVLAAATGRSVLWINVPRVVRDGMERHGIAHVRAGAALGSGALRTAIRRAGIPLVSPWYAEAFALRLPDGEVLPLPSYAFRRVVELALLALPFVARDAIEGAPAFDATELTVEAESAPPLPARDPELLFERHHAACPGLLETLVLADAVPATDPARARWLYEGLVDRRHRSPQQLAFRRGRLAALGLVARGAPTPLGRQILGERAAEVADIRRRIADLLDEERVEALDGGLPEDDEPAEVLAARVELTAAAVRPHLAHLDLAPDLVERLCAALSAGKHLLLVGPPGTGKTELGLALGEAARVAGCCSGLFTATASADWTTYETIGGYALERDGSLRFRPGVFLTALEQNQWLLVDELNRADVDRAFGELLTVLSGRGASTPFKLPDGRTVSVGPEAGATHRVPPSFRLIATMNTWDRGALFRLSYALLRRFAVIHVGAPDDAGYARLLDRHASELGDDPSLDPATRAALGRLFRSTGLLAHRPLGPAVALDMIRYIRRRAAPGEGLAEAIAMYLLPQLEGLPADAAAAVADLLDTELAAVASPRARLELRARLRELFPDLRLPDA